MRGQPELGQWKEHSVFPSPWREKSLAPSLIDSAISSPEPPAMNMTLSQALEGTVTLTCWAFSFSPRNMSLA